MARIKFNPSRTRVHKGRLKIGVDIYSGLESTVPYLCKTVWTDDSISLPLVEEWIADILTSDVLTTIELAVKQPNSAHLISSYTKDKRLLSSRTLKRLDRQDRAEINAMLSGLDIFKDKGIYELITPGSIDIGAAATARASELYFDTYTFVGIDNAANAAGSLDTVEIYLRSGSSLDVYAGTFSKSGSTFTCRDSEELGNVTVGSKQTYDSLDIDVESGDYIGCATKAGVPSIEYDSSGGAGLWYVSGEYIDPTDSASFTEAAAWMMSLYGTGTESGSVNVPAAMSLYRMLGG